jgi:hypothetical protein
MKKILVFVLIIGTSFSLYAVADIDRSWSLISSLVSEDECNINENHHDLKTLDIDDNPRCSIEIERNPNCGVNDGVVLASATGGEAPYTFKWENGLESARRRYLAPGGYSVTVTDALQNSSVCYTYLTMLDCAKIGNYVWLDCPQNGIQDIGESGVPDVQVNLYKSNGLKVRETVTNAQGFYLFDDLPYGKYYVQFDVPEEYITVPYKTGYNATIDSDVDQRLGPGTTPIQLISEEECDFENFDLGLMECIPIGDIIWADTNANNLRDSLEQGLNGIKVQLWETINEETILIEEQLTSNKPEDPTQKGYYQFCVLPGLYELRIVDPQSGLVITTLNLGEAGDLPITHSAESTIDNDFNASLTTGFFNVNCGDQFFNVGAGFIPFPEFGNRVWLDLNQNGIQDTIEQGIANVLVEAYDSDDNFIQSTVSDADGAYKIDYLTPGKYYLKITPPESFSITPAFAGDSRNLDSDVDGSNGDQTTAEYELTYGDQLDNIDIGIIFGVVASDWLSFTAEAEANANILEWQVANSSNTSHFIIQRRLGTGEEFENLDRVEVTASDYYTYGDGDVYHNDSYYYRIKQMDKSSEVSYSDVIRLERTREEILSAEIYPNPSREYVNIKLNLPEDGQVHISLIDLQGKQNTIITTHQKLDAGVQTLVIDTHDLSAGLYAVRIEYGNQKLYKRLVVTK